MDASLNPQDTAKDRFTKLSNKRAGVLERAERSAKLTIPALMPPEGHTESTSLPAPYQGLGARLVNTLAAKLLTALFPPNTAFFRLSADADVEAAAVAQGGDSDDIRKALAKVEQKIIAEHEKTKARPVLFYAMKQLIVCGNALVQITKDGAYRYFGVRQFVVERDHAGSILDVIVKESVAVRTLDDNLKALLTQDQLSDDKPDAEVCIYTWMKREGNKYKVHQELEDQKVPGSDGTYDLNAPGFIVLRWSFAEGDDYGRGLTDEYYGDFKALDDLCRDLLKASAQAAKILFLLRPNSPLRQKDLATAESGDVLVGDPNDVGTVHIDKLADFKITVDRINELKDQLSKAFLANTSIQRNAERVTAEEIRYMAQELEDALGGIYSTLAHELQSPLVARLMVVLQRKELIPPLPKDDLNVTITTGVEALGRGHELNKLVGHLRTLSEVVGAEAVAQRLKFDAANTRVSTALGIDTEGLFKTDEEMEREMNNVSGRNIAEQAIPAALQNAMTQGTQ